jgi:FMN phosphatase YigB (HAD superfamily)
MIIAFDFDRVLFRTEEFKEFLDDEIPGFLEKYPEEGRYNPEEHAERLGVDKEEIFEALEEAERFVYGDLEVLEGFPDRFELVIVSRGDPSFQERKIRNSGALEFFDNFFIVEDESKDSVTMDFLVDDWEKEVEEAEVPGYVFDRSEEGLEDVREFILEEFRDSQ